MTQFDTEILEAAEEIISEFGVSVSWSQQISGKADLRGRSAVSSVSEPVSVKMSPPTEYDEKWVGLDHLRDCTAIAFVRPEDLVDGESTFQPLKNARLSFPTGQKFMVDKIVSMISGESVPMYALGLSG